VADWKSEESRFEPTLGFLALPLPNSPNSIWLKFTAVVENAAPGRAPRGVARHGTARYGTVRHGTARYGTVRHPAPPPLYFLAGVTRGANFYGPYYFAFLECALPGVNTRPQFGQCRTVATLALAVRRSKRLARSHPHLARSHPHLARSHPWLG
jgi:hypothetical protein